MIGKYRVVIFNAFFIYAFFTSGYKYNRVQVVTAEESETKNIV